MKKPKTFRDRRIQKIAKEIAEAEIGGAPKRCWGHIANRYDAAFNAAVKALSRSREVDCE